MFQRCILLFLYILQVLGNFHGDFWQEIDPNYELDYLDPVGVIHTDSVVYCAMTSLQANVTAFGYRNHNHKCLLFNVDYYGIHNWPAGPGLTIYLRNEEIVTDPFNCIQGCGFCMPIVTTKRTWTEANSGCFLLEWDGTGYRRCMMMQLQYLRMPSSNKYWVGASYNLLSDQYEWSYDGTRVDDTLWRAGDPWNIGVNECVLMSAGTGEGYLLQTADCSEKHFALCVTVSAG